MTTVSEVMDAMYRSFRKGTPLFTYDEYRRVASKVKELIDGENKMDDITITSFRSNGRTIYANSPFIVKGFIEQGLLMYSDDAIGLDCVIHKGQEHRAPLLVVQELAFIWREYADEADDKLDTEALRLKRNLRERFRG